MVLALILFTIGATCQCAPTASTPVPAIRINAKTNTLVVGEKQPLIVVDSSSGQPVLADLQWSQNHPDVCDVSRDGLVTALRPGLATITVVNGTQSAMIDLEVVAAFSGEWSGQILLRSERRLSGVGPIRSSPPGPYPYQLSIQQAHGQITARDTRNPEVVLILAGTINFEGHVSLRGAEDIPGAEGFHMVTDPWDIHLDANGRFVDGEYMETSTFTNFFGRQVYETHTQILAFFPQGR